MFVEAGSGGAVTTVHPHVLLHVPSRSSHRSDLRQECESSRPYKGSFIPSGSDTASRWVHKESNLMFTLNSDRDQRKKFASGFALAQ